MKEDTFCREKLVYSATTNDDSHSDLVGGKVTKEDLWRGISDFLEVAHWASNRQIQIWLRGFATDRYSTLEEVLKQKGEAGDLRVEHYGKPKVYAKPRKTRGAPKKNRPYLRHGLSCTEVYLRLQKSKKGVGVPSGDLRGYGVVPDLAIEYLNSVLWAEFETSTDTHYHKRLEGKIIAYNDHVDEIQEAYKIPIVVLFILDVDRDLVKKKVQECDPDGRIFFCDYQTFKSKDNVLLSPIWIWKDGKEYSIIK